MEYISLWILFAPVYGCMGTLRGRTVDTDRSQDKTLRHTDFKDLAKEEIAPRVLEKKQTLK